jgi:hypothetical protein
MYLQLCDAGIFFAKTMYTMGILMILKFIEEVSFLGDLIILR